MKRLHACLAIILLAFTLILILLSWLLTIPGEYSIAESDIPSLQPAWETKLKGEGIGSMILIDSSLNMFFVMTYSELSALNLETGEIIWTNESSGGHSISKHTLQVQEHFVLAIGKKPPFLRAFSKDTGDLLWEKDYATNPDGSKNSWVTSILSDKSQVYIATNRKSRGADVEAVDISSGQLLWRTPHQLFGAYSGISGFHLTKNRLYVKAGNFYGMDKQTGEILEHYADLFVPQDREFIDNFVAYHADGSAHATQLVPDQANSAWRNKWQTSLARYPNGITYIFDNVDDDAEVLYASASCNSPIRWCSSVLKLSKENGNLIWAADTNGTPTSITAEGEDLFALTTNASLTHIDASTGAVKGTLQFAPKTNDTVGRQTLAYTDGWLVVTNGNNQLFGFRTTD